MCKTYGYCRISRKEQSIERQQRNILKAFPDAVLICEAYTGTRLDRPEWQRLTARLRHGDTVVFDSVSRMSRSAAEGWQAYRSLYEAGIELVFLKEPQINTATYRQALTGGVAMTGTDADLILAGVNAYLLRLAERQVQLAFEQAEKEVDDLHQRTREGIETARLAGKQIGQQAGRQLHVKKADEAKAIILKHCRAFGGGLADGEVMTLAGISRNTFYKYKRELCKNCGLSR